MQRITLAAALLAATIFGTTAAHATTYTYSFTAPNFTRTYYDANLSRQFTTADFATFSFTTDALLGAYNGTSNYQWRDQDWYYYANYYLQNQYDIPHAWKLTRDSETINILSWAFTAGPVSIDNNSQFYSDPNTIFMLSGFINTDANGMPTGFNLNTQGSTSEGSTTIGIEQFPLLGFHLRSTQVQVVEHLSRYDLNGYAVATVNSAVPFPNTWTMTASVPEADTYAMMLAGLGLMGFVARRRKQSCLAAQ